MMTRRNLLAAALIAPLLLLVFVSFIVPLGATLYRAVEDAEISTILPKTTALLEQWNGEGVPSEQTYLSLMNELREAQEQQKAGPVLNRLNFEETGLRSMLLQGLRASGQFSGPYKHAGVIRISGGWSNAAPGHGHHSIFCARSI